MKIDMPLNKETYPQRNLQISENFMHLILLDGFWQMQIAFGSMVKFYSLAQFLVDHLLHQVVPGVGVGF